MTEPIGTEVPVMEIWKESPQNPLVTFRPDGTVEFGPDYTPDAAAKQVWEFIASQGMPSWQEMATAAGWSPPMTVTDTEPGEPT